MTVTAALFHRSLMHVKAPYFTAHWCYDAGGFLYIYLDILLYILHTQKSIFKGAFPFCSVYINKSGEDEHLCVSDIVQSGYKKKY